MSCHNRRFGIGHRIPGELEPATRHCQSKFYAGCSPAGAAAVPLFSLTNCQRARPDSTPKSPIRVCLDSALMLANRLCDVRAQFTLTRIDLLVTVERSACKLRRRRLGDRRLGDRRPADNASASRRGGAGPRLSRHEHPRRRHCPTARHWRPVYRHAVHHRHGPAPDDCRRRARGEQ